jgi:hypothetical protein
VRDASVAGLICVDAFSFSAMRRRCSPTAPLPRRSPASSTAPASGLVLHGSALLPVLGASRQPPPPPIPYHSLSLGIRELWAGPVCYWTCAFQAGTLKNGPECRAWTVGQAQRTGAAWPGSTVGPVMPCRPGRVTLIFIRLDIS